MAGSYAEALSLYKEAVEYFRREAQSENNPAQKGYLEGKVREYQARAGKLEGFLASEVGARSVRETVSEGHV
jgi:hypothetical protein